MGPPGLPAPPWPWFGSGPWLMAPPDHKSWPRWFRSTTFHREGSGWEPTLESRPGESLATATRADVWTQSPRQPRPQTRASRPPHTRERSRSCPWTLLRFVVGQYFVDHLAPYSPHHSDSLVRSPANRNSPEHCDHEPHQQLRGENQVPAHAQRARGERCCDCPTCNVPSKTSPVLRYAFAVAWIKATSKLRQRAGR